MRALCLPFPPLLLPPISLPLPLWPLALAVWLGRLYSGRPWPTQYIILIAAFSVTISACGWGGFLPEWDPPTQLVSHHKELDSVLRKRRIGLGKPESQHTGNKIKTTSLHSHNLLTRSAVSLVERDI